MSESTFNVGDAVTPVEPIQNPSGRWLRPGVNIGRIQKRFPNGCFNVYFRSSCCWVDCTMRLRPEDIKLV